MKTFTIEHKESVFYTVKARTYDEAVRKVQHGEVDPEVYASDYVLVVKDEKKEQK